MRCTFLILLIVSSLNLKSQSDALPELASSFTALIVENIDSSVAWYERNLGFELYKININEERGFAQANLERSGSRLELIEIKGSPSIKDIQIIIPDVNRLQGIFKFGFDVEGFDHWISHLQSSGVQFSGDVVNDPVSDKRMVIILDPDGNRVQLFER